MNLPLRIFLQKPPVGVDFGLQKGAGTKYETVQTQRSGLEDLWFELTIGIHGDRQEDDLPRFRGPFVQGKAANPFLYIDIGEFAGQAGGWSRRLKIPLTGITWTVIDQVAADPTRVLEARVPGALKDGTPNCATVKPFGGWEVR
jgi:hypothetical protein